MERLTAEDQLMLWPDDHWPQQNGALAVLDGSTLLEPDGCFRIDIVRRAIEARLHLVPRFRHLLHIPRRGLGPPLWVDAPAFDLNDHVQVFPLPPPGDEAQLLAATEQLRRRRLDRSRPLWQMWFLPGLPNDRVGMFVTMHHAIADGIAAVATGRAFLDTVADTPAASVRPWIPAPLPTARELLADNSRRHVDELRSAGSTLARPVTALRQVRAAWPAMHELFTTEPAPPTSLNRLVGPDRNLALIRSGIDLVREIAHRHDAKLNDVLLALTAGGLRGLLHSRGEPVENVTVPIYVPVTLRQGPRDQARGNLIGQMVVPIPLGPTDPGRRLRQIAAETAKRKTRSRPALGTVFRSRVVSGALLKVMNRRPVNVTTADVPGPQMPVYLAGAKVIEMFPVLPLIATVSLGVGALSYADQFDIMAIADRDAYPDLDVFTDSARKEMQALAATR